MSSHPRRLAVAATAALLSPLLPAVPAAAAAPDAALAATWVADGPGAGDHVKHTLTSRTITAGDVGATIQLRVTPTRGASLDCAHQELALVTDAGRSPLGRNWYLSGCWRGGVNLVAQVTGDMVGGAVVLEGWAAPEAGAAEVALDGKVTLGDQVQPSDATLRVPGADSPQPLAPSPSAAPAQPSEPAPPPAAGRFHRLVFHDEFDSLDTIDRAHTGASGHKWFTNLPWGGSFTPADRITGVGDGVVQVDQAVSNQNVALSSLDPVTGAGRSFGHGYFEVRMRFDPSGWNRSRPGFPAVWLLPRGETFQQTGPRRHGEIDMFEAFRSGTGAYEGAFVGTLHDVQPVGGGGWDFTTEMNRNNVVPGQVDGGWHTYGVRWDRGAVRYFMDGRELVVVEFGPHRRPSAPSFNFSTGAANSVGAFAVVDEAAEEGMVLMVGTAPDWPIQVDHVRVWSK